MWIWPLYLHVNKKSDDDDDDDEAQLLVLKKKDVTEDSVKILNIGIGKHEQTLQMQFKQDQGPVVQSIVSLTSSVRGQLVKCFTTL